MCSSGEAGSGNAGKAYWEDTMTRTLAKVSDKERSVLRNRLFVLGRRVGHEWARDNDVRKIDTGDLKRWGASLKSAVNSDSVLTVIERKAMKKLGL